VRNVIVVDASVLTVALGDDEVDGRTARARIHGESLAAPELIDLEVASVLRRRVAAGSMSAERARLALADLTELPMQRASHRPLLSRCWELRQTVTVYDAAYVALAEMLQVVLLTADSRLSRAPGVQCVIDVVS
jgi:predicted nucleic acid-binding protein